VSYTPNTPGPGTSPAATRGPIETNFTVLNTFLGQDHVAPDEASNQCLHKKVTLIAPIADPSVGANQGILYTKTVGSHRQLYFRNEESVQQLTGFAKGGTADAQYIDLPGNLRLQWGRRNTNLTAGGTSTITFPIAFSAAPLSIQCTLRRDPADGGTDATAVVSTANVTTTSFQVRLGSGANNNKLYWFAIGFHA
jgi:hypothetical protein